MGGDQVDAVMGCLRLMTVQQALPIVSQCAPSAGASRNPLEGPPHPVASCMLIFVLRKSVR